MRILPPSLDRMWDDNGTGEIHLGFTKRSSRRPETESATRQYRRHQRNYRSEGNKHFPAYTVWNTRN